MEKKTITAGEARYDASRRRNMRVSLLIAAGMFVTSVMVLFSHRRAFVISNSELIAVSAPVKKSEEAQTRPRVKRVESHAFQRQSTPQGADGSRASVMRAMAFGGLSLPDLEVNGNADGGFGEWVGMEEVGDFGEGVVILGGAARGGFFGISRDARRFAFVIDVSGSMNDSGGGGANGPIRRIEALKKQMRDSISALPEEAQFTIIFFNDKSWGIGAGATPAQRAVRWVDASDENKFKALKQLEEVTPEGGTEWVGPLSRALRLEPEPQVLYLLSDGEPSDWSTVRKFLHSIAVRGIAIDSIALECDAGGAGRLRQVATKTGGSYRRIEAGKVAEKLDSIRHPFRVMDLPAP